MKNLSLILILLSILFVINKASAQRDIIYKKDSTQIRCKIKSTKTDRYEYAFTDSTGKVRKAKIPASLVDSVHYNYYDTNLVQNKIYSRKTRPAIPESADVPKNWQFSFGIGLNAENFLEFNANPGPDKKTITAAISLDFALNYAKDVSRFAMTNELHSQLRFQKSGINSPDHVKRVSDNINTLHDFYSKIGKSKKWNFNLIARTGTSIFNIYDGEYLKDYNSKGQIQGFLSPYDVTISPGIKYEPDQYLRISISPYSFNLYGIKSRQVASTGIYIQELDGSGNYKRFLFNRLGAEINFWYDRSIKDWLQMQYRLGISSNYFEKIARNGLMDGLFITRVKLIKNLYLTDQVQIRGDFADKPFKPYISQSVMISFIKSF